MRNIIFNATNTYLLSGSGLPGSNIFTDPNDRLRFILLLLSLQSPIPIHNITWYLGALKKRNVLPFGEQVLGKIMKYKYIEVIAFGVSQNSYEIIIKTHKDHLPSVYMHRLLTAYGKYYSFKVRSKGHVFVGPFEAEKISNADLGEAIDQLHARHIDEAAKNPEIESLERFSSICDYTDKNRWGELLSIKNSSISTKSKEKYKYEILKLLQK